MAIFPGTLLSVRHYQEPPTWRRARGIGATVPPSWPPPQTEDPLRQRVGDRVARQPVVENTGVAVGHPQPTFADDWYDRVHVLPGTLSLGNVLSPLTRRIELWNATRQRITLSSLTASGATGGLSLSGQAAPPLNVEPLQSRLYTLAIDTLGDPVIEARYTFEVGGAAPSVVVTGARIAVWGFRPNWITGVTERLRWLTDVLTAYDGSEQRVRLRDQARRDLDYTALVGAQDARRLAAITLGWGARLYCLPLWCEADTLSLAVGVGDTRLPVTQAALKEYRIDGLVVVWRDAGHSEAGVIKDIVDNTLWLQQPLARSYPASARVMPGVLARLRGETPTTYLTDAVISAPVRFEVEGHVDRAPAEIGPLWQGYAVLDVRPDRTTEVTETASRLLSILDTHTGPLSVDDTRLLPVIRRTLSWWLVGRTELARWKQWAAARAGRYQGLWLPSFADDVKVVLSVSPGDTALRIDHTGSGRYVGTHPLRAALRIELNKGQVFHRRVTGVTELDETTEAVGLDSALGLSAPPTDFRRVMWMSLARLDADTLEFHYETDAVARLAATFVLVSQ
jgi:hypothetical protein